jgi:hypothetical protein
MLSGHAATNNQRLGSVSASQTAAERSSEGRVAEVGIERLRQAFLIHPEMFDRFYEDWSTLSNFQRTRGVLQLLAQVPAEAETEPVGVPGRRLRCPGAAEGQGPHLPGLVLHRQSPSRSISRQRTRAASMTRPSGPYGRTAWRSSSAPESSSPSSGRCGLRGPSGRLSSCCGCPH